MLDNQLGGLLGMAVRARKVLFGETAFEAINSKFKNVLLISDDASDRTMKKLINRADYYEVEYFVVPDSIINDATGNTTRKYCVVNDEGFSKGILDICRKR